MGYLTVPKGKKVVFREGGEALFNEAINLILDSEVTIQLQTQFKPVVDADVSVLANIMSEGARAIGLNIGSSAKELGFQVWGGTSPATCALTVTLNTNGNAFESVVEPATKLMGLALPSDLQASGGSGFGLKAPGPGVFDVIGGTKQNPKISVQIGNIVFPWVVVTGVEPTMSLDCDEDGDPIWIKLQINFQGVFTATRQEIASSFRGGR